VSRSLRLVTVLDVLSKYASAGPRGYPPARASYPGPSHAPRDETR
jgi:hypothetical protein